MSDAQSRSPVLVLDPDSFTPYYDVNFCEALALRGWRVEWLTSPFQFEPIPDPHGASTRHLFFAGKKPLPDGRAPGSPILRRARKAIAYPLDMLRLSRELMKREPGILHVQWALLPRLDALLWRRLRGRGWRIVYTVHEAARLIGAPRLKAELMGRWLLREADWLLTHSEAERMRLIELGAAPERVTAIPQGAPGIFHGREPSREEARKALGIDAARRVVLFFGMIKPYKGLDTLLQAFPLVRRAAPQALLLIAGEPMMPMGRMSRLAAELERQGSLVWRRGFVPSGRTPSYFAAADVVALPYRAASTSAVLPAAFDYGRPVAAAAVGGLPEMVEPHKTGLVVPPEDPAALAAALVELLSDPDRCDAMGERARQRALERHSWDRIAEIASGVYDRLLRPPP